MAAKKQNKGQHGHRGNRGNVKPKAETPGMKFGFYLPVDLMDRLRDVAWFERKSASGIVRRLIESYVDERKRIPKRPKGEADQD
jgi:hypothetical protein